MWVNWELSDQNFFLLLGQIFFKKSRRENFEKFTTPLYLKNLFLWVLWICEIVLQSSLAVGISRNALKLRKKVFRFLDFIFKFYFQLFLHNLYWYLFQNLFKHKSIHYLKWFEQIKKFKLRYFTEKVML